MVNTISEISSFIDLAKRNRKYPTNTALGYKAALKRFETVLNADEQTSFSLIRERFDQLISAFFEKNKADMTAGSLETYRKRLLRLFADYEKWGSNPQNWGSWSRPVIIRRKKMDLGSTSDARVTIPSSDERKNNPVPVDLVERNSVSSDRFVSSTKFEIPIRPGVIAFVSTPNDLTKSEVEKIKKYVDYLSAIAREDG